jgi:hypothetical protein
LNYLSALAARAQRRTKSSFIEWAVETALNAVSVPGTSQWGTEGLQSIDDLANQLWDVDEPDRLVALAFHAPILMTHEEQVLWKLIREHGYLWRGRWLSISGDDEETWTWEVQQDRLIMDRVRKYFEIFKTAARGEADGPVPVPSWTRTRKVGPKPDNSSSSFADDLDEDIPF